MEPDAIFSYQEELFGADELSVYCHSCGGTHRITGYQGKHAAPCTVACPNCGRSGVLPRYNDILEEAA